MFTVDEIRRIKRRLDEGATGEAVAEEMGMPFSSFRNRLANSGYRIKLVATRELEEIRPVAAVALAGANA